MNTVNIAIDGPAGAGKSSIAKAVSGSLGYIYVDTGALYRAVALFITENNIPDSDIESRLAQADISLGYKDGVQHVYIAGRDVSDLIRTPEVSMEASRTSAMPAVRKYLFETQKKIARENNVVMDGRDIGTVVLPDADVKLFVTATCEERAKRRYAELSADKDVSYDDILRDIIKRDENDRSRETAPLRMADDAVKVDTTSMDLETAVNAVLGIIKQKIGGGAQ